MTDAIIQVEGLGKRYSLGKSRADARYRTLREGLTEALRAPFRRWKKPDAPEGSSTDFWALRDVNFEVKRGEVLGVIGRNGAGKSTLLKVLSRITEPTTGRIRIGGRVASLLEVGTGFHPELTGRENIYLNGAILGMHRTEIRAKFDEIVAFAEVEKFLDTPVKRYSSGMYVRLAFAVAAYLEPEILIVDEVLAVGDAEFQKKCLGKIGQVAKGDGRTVLFVSHQLNAVQTLCSRCMLLAQGRVVALGSAEQVLSAYLQTSAMDAQWINEASQPKFDNPYFLPQHFSLVDSGLGRLDRPARADEEVGVIIDGNVSMVDPALVVGFAVYSSDQSLLFWTLQTDLRPEEWPPLHKGDNRLVCWLPKHLLNEGDYRIELIVSLHHRVWFCQPGINAPSLFLQVRGGLSESPHWMAPRPGLLSPVLSFTRLV